MTEENKQAGQAQQDNVLGLLCHLTAFAGFIIPFGNILGPLVVWLTSKEKSAFADDQGKESLNFQITISIAALVALPLCFIIIGVPLLFAIAVLNIIFVIIASIKAYGLEKYRYPFALRLVK